MIGETPQAPAALSPTAHGHDGWLGLGVAAGSIEAPARLIRTPQEGARLTQAEILVAPTTDPGWTPLFLRAGGLVMEKGGSLSHGAIVAREFGLPAVVNIPGVLDLLHDGEIIRVDGDTGVVQRLS